jgi:pyrroline-5-carboxylate reductase
MSKIGKLGLIGGAGMIGRAILEGVLEQKLVKAADVHVTARHKRSLEKVAHLGVHAGVDNVELVKNCDTILLAVHPDRALAVVAECSDALIDGQLLLSVVTGVRTEDLLAASGDKAAVVRVIPNIATIVAASITSLCPGERVTAEQMEIATAVFDAVGSTLVLEERHLNACTGLAGCGPAFAFKVVESLAEGGVKMGLPREAARKMAAWVLLGAARLVLQSGKHPAELKEAVTTPGGCTIDGIAELEARGLPIAMIAAVETSTLKAAKLAPGDN